MDAFARFPAGAGGPWEQLADCAVAPWQSKTASMRQCYIEVSMVDEPVKTNRHGKAPIDPAIQSHIGLQLRAMYEETAAEPVPDNLLRLLDALGGGTKVRGDDESARSKLVPGRKASEST